MQNEQNEKVPQDLRTLADVLFSAFGSGDQTLDPTDPDRVVRRASADDVATVLAYAREVIDSIVNGLTPDELGVNLDD